MADLFSRFVFDPQAGAASPSRKLPKELVLSSQYTLTFQIGEKYYNLFDIDSISKTLKVEQKKAFRPYGFSHQLMLNNHLGWDIRISGKKSSDGLVDGLVQQITELNNNPNAFYPRSDKPYGANPTISLIEEVSNFQVINGKQTNVVVESYKYNELILTGFDQEAPEDNSPITYSLSFFARSRVISLGTVKEIGESKIDAVLNSVRGAINNNPSYRYVPSAYSPGTYGPSSPTEKTTTSAFPEY